MKTLALTSLFVAGMAAAALAQSTVPSLSVSLGGIDNGKPIDAKFAYCMPDGKGTTKDGGNINPAVNWAGAPPTVKSYALIVVDPDVPGSFELANKAGKRIAADFPRQNFYHWVLIDIPSTITNVSEGADSKGVTPGGKPLGSATYGISGQNDYAAKANMGQGGGYDGPCPPWNDERLHHYHFVVYALDVPSLGLSGNFTGAQAEKAMSGHILAKGEAMGTYSDNPAVK